MFELHENVQRPIGMQPRDSRARKKNMAERPKLDAEIVQYETSFGFLKRDINSHSRFVIFSALYDYAPNDAEKLPFATGDVIVVLRKSDSGWWDGITNHKRGWFPSNYVTAPETIQMTPKKTFGWIARKSHNQITRTYHNRFTGETKLWERNQQVSIIDHEDETEGQLAVDGVTFDRVDAAENLPPNWGTKTSVLGKKYYYNVITNETTWSLDDIDNMTGQLKIKSERNEDAKSILSKEIVSSPSLSRKTSTPTLLSVWDQAYGRISHEILLLKEISARKEKQKYLQQTSNIVSAIQGMLKNSKTLEKESSVLKTNKMLAIHHRHILKALSKLVLSAKHASNVWPTPDSTVTMCSDVNEVQLAVRHFTMTAKDAHVFIEPFPDPEALREPLSSVSAKPEEINIDNNHFYSKNSYNTQAVLESIDSTPKSVESEIIILHRIVDQREMNLEFGKDIISKTRDIVTEVGQFLSMIDDIDVTNVKVELLGDFQKNKESLYNSIRSLVSASTAAIEPLPNVDAFDQVVTCSKLLETSVNDLAISSKFVLEEKEELDNIDLQKETEKIQETLDESYVSIKPRRALSMNNACLEENGNEASILDEMNDAPAVVSSSFDKHKQLMEMPHFYNRVDLSPIPGSRPASPAQPVDVNMGKTALSNKPSVHKYKPRRITTSGGRRLGNGSGTSKISQFFGEDAGKDGFDTDGSNAEWFLGVDHSPKDLLLSMEGMVKGATLSALVERLTSHDVFDFTLVLAFLMTFRTLTNADTFLALLKGRWNLEPPEDLHEMEMILWTEKKFKPVRIQVFNVLKTWLESYFVPEDSVILSDLWVFAETEMRDSMSHCAEQICNLIDLRRENPDSFLNDFKDDVAKEYITPPTPVLPRSLKRLKLSEVDPLELARQLTLVESRLYNSIKPSECLGKAWSDKDNLAPNIRAMIHLTNQITGWVAETILAEKDIKKRCSVMKYFILVGDKCRSLSNYNGLMAILAALNSSPVHRLKRTKELLSSKTRTILTELKRLMAPGQNFSNYRNELRSVDRQCVPFLGMFLTDLTFIEDGNGDRVKSMPHLINFDKRIKTAEKIKEIQQYQTQYNFIEVSEIRDFMNMCIDGATKDAEELYQRSLQIEPREREDEKIARLLQEVGFL